MNKKLGKRTYTLKELAKSNFNLKLPKENVTPELMLDAAVPNENPSIINLAEDLLESESINVLNLKDKSENKPSQKSHPIELLERLIQKEIKQTAVSLKLEAAELGAWIEAQIGAPKLTILRLLRIANAYDLDPIKEEVALALYDDQHWQVFITVEGYSKVLNRHPAFDGLNFNQSPEESNGIPLWMECTIYRKDRFHPIKVREYFDEVKSGQAIWQKMPRRMLRHRVLQQCARLAVG